MTTHEIPVRLDLDRYATGFGRAMAHLDKAAIKELDAANIDPLLRELVKIRASQLNGCAYCVDMHTPRRQRGGRDRAAPARRRRVGGGPVLHRPGTGGAGVHRVRHALGDHPRAGRGLRRRRRRVRAREVGALLSLIVTINAWNAVGVATRAWVPGSYEP